MTISSTVVGESNDDNSFPHKLLLTDIKVSNLRKAFVNGSSANINLSKIQLHKIGHSGEFLGRLLGSILKTELPLMKNVFEPLAKSVLMQSGLTAVAAAPDSAVHKKMFVKSTTTLIISNEEINDIMKIVKSLEESGLLIAIKGVSKTIKNEATE